MGIDVIEVAGGRDLADFIRFPYDLYKNHPIWVPPLKVLAAREFDRRKNGFFKKCDAALFLARRNGVVKGRIAAFVHHGYIDYWKVPLGFFGSFESINDREVSRALFSAAADWLKSKKMADIRGPFNFTSQNIGFLVAGFSQPHTVLSPYNFPYYDELVKDAGFTINMEMNGYYGDVLEHYVFPDRFMKHYNYLAKRYNVRVRGINLKKIRDEVTTILAIANDANRGDWNVPAGESEIDSIIKDFSGIVDPDCVFIMEQDTVPIGYAIALPDVNVIIKKLNGRLFPFGIFRIKLGVKKIREYRLWGLGLIKEFQNKALDTLLYYHIFHVLSEKHARLEASWIREDNYKMNQALVNLHMKLVKKFRVYQKKID
ncbi:MAG: hypothetical protein JW765_12970 [Deltaproteobacteria bacterium]|nr:hypothetical protein [Candidatus Zymogenaceae bacterium]